MNEDELEPGGARGQRFFEDAQETALAGLRKKYMTVTYSDGTTVDYSGGSKYFLYAAEVPESSADLASYTSDSATNSFFR